MTIFNQIKLIDFFHVCCIMTNIIGHMTNFISLYYD